jgi:hypothetical protein
MNKKSFLAGVLAGLAFFGYAFSATEDGPDAAPAGEPAGIDAGTRPLTDLDMERYIAISTQLTEARKRSAAGASAGTQAKQSATPGATADPPANVSLEQEQVRIIQEHGMSLAEFYLIDGRVNAAALMMGLEKFAPIPDEKQAEVALIRKYLERIKAARADN